LLANQNTHLPRARTAFGSYRRSCPKIKCAEVYTQGSAPTTLPWYLAHMKPPFPTTLNQAHAQVPTVVLGGGLVIQDQGTASVWPW